MVPGSEIGILGGSYNPVHCGHIMLASWIAQYTSLLQVWMLLSPSNPLKSRVPEHYDHRMAMLNTAIGTDPLLRACDIELSLPAPSYTINTLEALEKAYPQYKFRLVIGSDNWCIFRQWHRWEDIMLRFSPIIYPRPGYSVDPKQLPSGAELVDAPVMDISSTMIRRAIADGKNMSHFLPTGVYDYILQHKLYI